MTRIVDICDIINDLTTETYEHAFDVSFDNTLVLETADFLNEIEMMHFEKSFISHHEKEYDVTEFIHQWSLYKARHMDEWKTIFANQSAEIDPKTDYYEYTTVTPDITTENSVEYGRTTTTTNTNTDTMTNNRESVGQTNTYDGELRNTSKLTDGENTSKTNIGQSGSSMGGKDTSTNTTTGTTTSEKKGYRDNPYDNLQKSIEYVARFNLRDLIINGFCMEFLFYNNDNGGNGWYNEFLY